jgi:multidrug efflux pump subunit AcrA (membrane-fusion protein)
MRLGVPARLRTRGPALRLSAGAVALAAIGVTTFAYANRSTPIAKVATARVQRGAVALTSSAAGTVQAAGTRGLSFSTSGTVTEVDVKAGDSVTAGQVLAKMDPAGVQDDVDAAQSSVDSATDALTKAQQTSTPSATGSANRSSTGTATTCQITVKVAPAALTWGHPSPSPSASASPAPSPSASPSPSPPASTSPPAGGHGGNPGGGNGGTGSGGGGRGTGTCTGGSGSGSGSGSGGSGAGGSGSGGSGSGGSGTGGSGSGGRVNTGDSLMSAEQQLTNAKLALQLAQDKLAGTTITAPVAGKVLSVAGTVGVQQTPGGSGFIVLGEVTDTAVRAQFSEADVAHLAVGQPATITLPNKDGQQIAGKVSQIDPAGTASGRLVRYGVLIAFDQVPDDLLLGQSANVAVTTASATNVLFVPSAAVTGVTNGTGTIAVRAGDHDVRRTVRVGLQGDQYTEVRSGVDDGDELVISSAG